VQQASETVHDQTSCDDGRDDGRGAGQADGAAGSRELLVDLRGLPRGRLADELERSLRGAVRSGRLRPGARLPSTRTLAADLGVSRSVVVQAYEQLGAEGYLTTRPGAVARVSDITAPARGEPAGGSTRAAPGTAPAGGPVAIDLRPGSPSLTSLPRGDWATAVRRALATMTDAELGYGDSRGLPRLREALADYLGRVRGAIVDPDRLVVVNGFAQGLVVMARLLRERGATTVGVEDPGSIHTSTHLAAHGVDILPVPVDDQGINIGGLDIGRLDIGRLDSSAGARLGAVLVTPAHQFPTGAVLSPARRLSLVEWAEHADTLVIEDDYDAEYRYDHHAVGALQGVAPDRVVLGGSVSKTLAPGLRLGWLAVPEGLSDAAAHHKAAIDLMTPVLEQAALAELITSGSYERHIRRSRAVYKRRRDLTVEVITDRLPDAEVRGASAGLHLVVMTPGVDDEAAVERAAAGLGVGVAGLRRHRHSPGPAGFVLGYGHLTDGQLRRALSVFASAVREVGRSQ
jgi:GntR family transcriptional regulator / MocR family aminotransferase